MLIASFAQAGVLPSGEAITAVPTTLTAICLNQKGLDRVKNCGALECFIPIFTTPMYLRALQVKQDIGTRMLVIPDKCLRGSTPFIILERANILACWSIIRS